MTAYCSGRETDCARPLPVPAFREVREHGRYVIGPGDRCQAVFPDNPAGKVWTRANITEGLEPSALPLGLSMQAAACELADRTHAGHWSPDLDAVLIPFAGDVRRE
jgi:hypothetical protein